MISYTESITQVATSNPQNNTNGHKNGKNSKTNHLPYQNGAIDGSSKKWTNHSQESKEQTKKSGYLFEEDLNNGFNFQRESADSTAEKEEASQTSMIIQLRNQLEAKEEKIKRLQKKIYNLQNLPRNPQRDLVKGSPEKNPKQLSLTVDEQKRMTKKLKEKIQQHKALQLENQRLQTQKSRLALKIERDYKQIYQQQIYQMKLQNQKILFDLDMVNSKLKDYEKMINSKDKLPLTKNPSSKSNSSNDYDKLNKDNERLKQQNSKMKQQVQKLKQIQEELNKQLAKIKEERGASKREKEELRKTIETLQKDLSESRSRINIKLDSDKSDSILHLTKTSERLLEQNTKLEENIKNLTEKNKLIQNQAEQVNRMYKQLKKDHEESAKQWKSEQERLQKEMNTIMHDANELIGQNESLQLKIGSLEDKCQKGRKENEKVSKALETLTTDFTQLRRNIDKMKLQIENQTKEKVTMTKKVESLSSDNEKLEKEKNALKNSITQLQKDKKTLQEKNKQTDKQLKQQRDINTRSQVKIKEFEVKAKTLEDNKKKLQLRITDLEEQIDRARNELSSVEDQRKKLLTFKTLVKQEMGQIQQELGMRIFEKKDLDAYIFKEVITNIIRLKYFNDSVILSKMENSKTFFLANQLKNFIGGPFRPQLAYRFDVLNTTNFHTYFDKKKNLLAIIQLKNGTVIGGFTESAFDPSITANYGKGFLFSITDQKVYKMRQQSKIPVNNYYDKYYFILGNAEIRLKSQQKKMFSNFAISNSTFDNAGGSKSKFLKVDEKTLEMTNSEVQIETYEFYQLKPTM